MKTAGFIVTISAAFGTALMIIGGPASAADSIYKSVDAEGHITYSDHPVSAASRAVSVNVPQADRTEAARIGKEQAIINTVVAQDEHRQSIEKKQKDEARHQREQRCMQARARLAELNDHARIYRRDEQGNRVYYSDAQFADLRNEAKNAADALCDD